MDLQKPRFLIGGVLGAITLAGIYVLWGPTVAKKRNFRGYVPGLHNLGNSCFLNAVLQALSSCETLIRWLGHTASFPTDQTTSYLDKNKSLISVLLKTLLELNYYESTAWKQDTCSPADVIGALRSHHWIISSDEQDAHELFHVLTTTLEEEISQCHSIPSLLDVRALQYPVCFDVFDSISLPLPNSFWGHLRIQDCLQKFISTECIQDVDCKECNLRRKQKMLEDKSNASEKSQFTKRLMIGKLPDCLCFHLQRTIWLSDGMPTKRGDHIVFPEFLSMASYIYPYCQKYQSCNMKSKSRLVGGRTLESLKTHISPSTYVNSEKNPDTSLISLNGSGYSAQKNTYQLKSVIVHLGDVFSGHFLTYRRGPLHTSAYNRWFCVSDTLVREVPISEVLQSSVYMLFYERCQQRH
ncbi:ubiquitin carboxyl-terminal hydrolase 30-like [Limulus polyphemus]|uniref:Ubiquitin carboxyl-terminal hydrolase n=1 Tax=Limulus polyphemus TaxID=6850 RepID=A0ABM1TI11_LIMPO|nr:ubiquitin carboxyl-terminal hydrolase 30-like [Limulus polyphemus]XP_022255518.1 ubiquitin carboxyl-terminal hydrolase 30-like [Limulus polyphemus]